MQLRVSLCEAPSRSFSCLLPHLSRQPAVQAQKAGSGSAHCAGRCMQQEGAKEGERKERKVIQMPRLSAGRCGKACRQQDAEGTEPRQSRHLVV